MRTVHVRMKKTLVLAAAGKMALTAGSASAALGKADSGTTTTSDGAEISTLSLEEVGYPLDLLTPPTTGINAGEADATLGKASSGSSSTTYSASSTGYLWAGELANSDSSSTTTSQPRIDFLVSGIRNDLSMQIYLAYATAGGSADAWLSTAVGQIELDPNSLQVIAAVQTQPDSVVAELPATPLGSVPAITSRSVSVPVVLNDLNNTGDSGIFSGNDIYFQAIAIPVDGDGNYLWDQAQASEIDHFTIERYESSTDSGSKNADASATASKASGDDNPPANSGGK